MPPKGSGTHKDPKKIASGQEVLDKRSSQRQVEKKLKRDELLQRNRNMAEESPEGSMEESLPDDAGRAGGSTPLQVPNAAVTATPPIGPALPSAAPTQPTKPVAPTKAPVDLRDLYFDEDPGEAIRSYPAAPSNQRAPQRAGVSVQAPAPSILSTQPILQPQISSLPRPFHSYSDFSI